MRIARHACAALLLMTAPALGDASGVPPPESVMLTGAVKSPDGITKADLARLPQIDVSLDAHTDQGPLQGTFRGVLLWTLIDRAGMVNADGKNAYLRHTILVSGADGYAVALGEGEIDPKLEGKQVILAFLKDGKPFDGLRLIVPGDAHAARDVSDVETIEVK